MGVQVTKEEMELIRQGKLDPNKIAEERAKEPAVPEHSVNLNELDEVKQELRETNILYKNAIQKNKDLYEEIAESRKNKETLRNKIAELRIKKKKILGTE